MNQNLRVPGPTPLPADVREAQAAPMIDHRGAEFAELLGSIRSDIARLTGSGTGAMEAAIVNTHSPGDRVLAVSIGSFGDRFAAIAEAFGASVERLDFEWGTPADPDRLSEALRAGGPYRSVLLTHNETSTGVANPIRELVAAVREAPGEPLALVDAISALGALPFEMDEWRVDLALSASQKAWMASPGIAIAAVGPRARAAEAEAAMPSFYWSFADARRWSEKGQTPWTPAVSVLFGLRRGVERLLAEGREATWARHRAVAAAAQRGVEALDLALLAAPGSRSPTVTAAWLPEGVDWASLNAALRKRGLAVAGGQGRLAGRILRLGHMGDVQLDDILDAITVLGEGLGGLRATPDPARAVDAARDAYRAEAGRGPAAAVPSGAPAARR